MPQRCKATIFMARNNFEKFLCGFASLWLCNFITLSQDDSTRMFSPISVFAEVDSITRISIVSLSVPDYLLNEERLKNLAVTDIGSALKIIPGVQLKDYGGIGGIKTVSYRSLGANQTGVIVDGNKLTNAQSGSINLSAFELFGLQEIRFTSGQVSDKNTSASSYLLTNSISVSSLLAQKPTKINLQFVSNSSSINSFENGILYQQPFGKNFFIGAQSIVKFGSGAYNYAYPISGIEGNQKRENSNLLNYKLKVQGGFDNEKSKLLLTANYYNNEQELPGAVVLYNPSNDQKLWNEEYRIVANYFLKFEKTKINFNAFHQNYFTRYFDPNFLNMAGFIDANYYQTNTGGGVLLHHKILKSKQDFFYGSDLIYSSLNGNNLALTPSRIENNSVLGLSGNLGQFKYAANLTVQLIQDNQKSTGVSTINNFSKASPFLSLAWLPFKKQVLRLRAFYKRSFTMPSFNDLYYNFIGNTNLKPEAAHVFNFGITYAKSIKQFRFELTTDFFYNKISNKIIAIPTKDLFNWSMQNIGKTQAQGIDINGLIAWQKNRTIITLNGSYSYNQSLDKTSETSSTYNAQIPYTPFHSANGSIAIDWKKFVLSTNLLYSGFRYTLNENIYANYLAPYTDITIVLSKKISLKNNSEIYFSASAHNVLNKNYEIIKSFPMPGRFYQFSFQFKL